MSLADTSHPPLGYQCRVCGQFHADLPLSYGAEAPNLWYDIPEDERGQRTILSSDQCEIDQRFFFVLGNIDLPIIGSDQVFSWMAWVSLSQENYECAAQLWHLAGREHEPSYFGWLSTSLPTYPDTLNLKTEVHTRAVGERPFIELEPTEHPLAIEQRTGITWQRIQRIAEILLHNGE
jgi:hypothetical protein